MRCRCIRNPRDYWLPFCFSPLRAGRRRAVQHERSTATASALGWADWSWDCTRDFNNTSPKYSGAKSISVTYLAWGALSLYHPATTLTNFHHLELYVNAGTNASMDLQVYLPVLEGVSFTALRVTNYVSGKTLGNTWKRALIPMADFNCTSSAFTRINFKEASGKTWGAAYLDSVTLINTNTPAGDTNMVNDFAITSRLDAATAASRSIFSGQTCRLLPGVGRHLAGRRRWSEVGMALGTARRRRSWTNTPTGGHDVRAIQRTASRRIHGTADADGLLDVYELQNTSPSILSARSAMPTACRMAGIPASRLSPTNSTGNDGDSGDPDGDGREQSRASTTPR